MKKVQIEISSKLLCVCADLIYREWAEAYDIQKKVHQEKNDGSRDWHLFHKERIAGANKELEKWEKLLAEIVSTAN